MICQSTGKAYIMTRTGLHLDNALCHRTILRRIQSKEPTALGLSIRSILAIRNLPMAQLILMLRPQFSRRPKTWTTTTDRRIMPTTMKKKITMTSETTSHITHQEARRDTRAPNDIERRIRLEASYPAHARCLQRQVNGERKAVDLPQRRIFHLRSLCKTCRHPICSKMTHSCPLISHHPRLTRSDELEHQIVSVGALEPILRHRRIIHWCLPSMIYP